jgi:hypothetical protein
MRFRLPVPSPRAVRRGCLLASVTSTLTAAVTAASAAPVHAQPPLAWGLDSGSVVRVHARAVGLRDQRLTVEGQRGDTLVLRARDGGPWLVPLAGVERLAVRTGRSRNAGARRGALIGLATGAVSTLALLPFAMREDTRCSECFVSATTVVAVFGTAFTLVSTGAGALIGSRLPRDQWQPVTSSRVRVGAAPARSGGVVAVRWAF